MKICLKYLNLIAGATGLNLGTLPDDGYTPVSYVATSAFAKGHIAGLDNEIEDIYQGSLVKTGAGVDPVSALVVPDFVGQLFIDTLGGGVWAAQTLVAGGWIDVVSLSGLTLSGLGDVTVTAILDGDIIAWNGSAWVNTKEIGAGHDRNAVGTSSLLGGANGTVFPGDSVAPYSGDRGTGVGGNQTEVYGDDSIALNDGESFGQRSVAMSLGKACGNNSFAMGSGAKAAGTGSVAFEDAQAGGQSSFAMGNLGTKTGWGARAVTLSNSGADLEVVIAAEDLTGIFTGGQVIQLFDFAGGTYDPTLGTAGHASVLALTVVSSALGAGDTTLTITGVNHNATSGFLNYDALGLHSLAFGQGAVAEGNHSAALGEMSTAFGDHSLAFGESVQTGEIGASPQPEYALAFGLQTKALFDHSQATGWQAQTRNYGERAHAQGYFSATEWAQERRLFLNQTVGTGLGPLPMYTDAMSGGTEEPGTFSDHGYVLVAYVIGTVDASGTVKTAAWKLEAVFQQDSGVLAQVGATITTLIANADVVVFANAPVLSAVANKIRIDVDDDDSGLDALDWACLLTLVELAAR